LTGQLGPNCQAAIPDIRTFIPGGEQALLITQNPAAGTLVGAGQHTIVTSIVLPGGEQQRCVTTFVVSGEGNQNSFQCPPDVVVDCDGRDGAVVRWEIIRCNPALEVICDPPSGSRFPVGVTTVRCRTNVAGAAPFICSFTVTVRCPQVQITRTAGSLALQWEAGGRLETATSVAGPWTEVPQASPPFQIQPTGPGRFYRVRY
jgi:hypothetical protein